MVVGRNSRNLHRFETDYPGAVRAAAIVAVLVLPVLAGCGGKGGGKGGGVGGVIEPRARTCAAGSFPRLGSSRIAYVAIVRSRVAVSRRPGSRAFARFDRLNLNHVPTIFSIRGAAVDATCNPRSYLVQVPRRPNVLTGWTQGGPIAIHGTNAPWSIGKAVSNGCIRLPNPVLKKVFAQALKGTPVLIRR